MRKTYRDKSINELKYFHKIGHLYIVYTFIHILLELKFIYLLKTRGIKWIVKNYKPS